MRFLLGMFLSLVACTSHAQIEASVSKSQQITGIKSPLLLGDRLLAEEVGPITTSPVALILVASPSEIRVDASNINREEVKLAKLDEGLYLLDSPGKTWVEIKEYVEFELNGVKRKFLSDSKTIVVELGAPGPGPGPNPPPGPSPAACTAKTNSNFENLAKRCCEWVSAVDASVRGKRVALAAIYKDASEQLADGRLLTINASSVAVAKGWEAALTDAERQGWESWRMKANEDLAKVWVDQSTNTAKRELMVQFYRSLSEGLAP